MKVIMYHYVQDYDSKFPNFRFLKFDNFKKQLDFFKMNYDFVSREEWLNFTTNGVFPDKKGKVILTFDDGLKCHYKYVFNELEKRNLFGIFFIPTFPYTNHQILDVHRVHLLCGAFSGKSLFDVVLKLVSDDMILENRIEEFKSKTYISQNNNEGVTDFKKLLNYFIDYKYRTAVIDRLCDRFDYNLEAESFYMDELNLKDLFDHGHFIGSHTVNHPVMSRLNKKKQRAQLKQSFNKLNSYNVIKEKIYCHPYGGFHSFNADTESILKEEGVLYSFNVEAREIIANDYKKSMQFLPRFDCNLFRYGKAN